MDVHPPTAAPEATRARATMKRAMAVEHTSPLALLGDGKREQK